MSKVSTKIQYGIRAGRLTHIDEVSSGKSCGCKCIACGAMLVARKGNKSTHYFVHSDKSSTCPQSAAISYLACGFFRQHVQLCLERLLPLEISWKCEQCNEQHKANLLEGISSVATEPHASRLTLQNPKGTTVSIIDFEKASSGAPSDVSAYFLMAPQSNAEIESLKKGNPVSAHSSTLCLRQKCACGGIFRDRDLHVTQTSCWRCHSLMNASYGFFGFGYSGPEDYQPREIEFLTEKGVIIREAYSRTAEDNYLANTCPSCGTFIGSHYIHELWGAYKHDDIFSVMEECDKCSQIIEKVK